jgi:NADH-ubiquinone oxidoreductase chain 1
MTEHSAVIFVFFFLAEYASIILMCILLSILFLGGYDPINISDYIYYIVYSSLYLSQFVIILIEDIFSTIFYNQSNLFDLVNNDIYILSKEEFVNYFSIIKDNSIINGLLFSLVLAIKSCMLIFSFI